MSYHLYKDDKVMGYKFLRQDPIVAGIGGGIAAAFDLPPWLIRIFIFISFFTSFGLTIIFYFAAAFSFSSKNSFEKHGDTPKLFGVCYYFSQKLNIDVGWLRFITLLASIFTGFFPVPFMYLVSYFFLQSEEAV